jgi:hypothetical protein
MSAREDQIVNRQSTPLGVLARLWWMLAGNVLLAFSLLFIFRKEDGFLHPADGVFWITVATLVLVRYLDIRLLAGQTATGDPASAATWTRYVVGLMVSATVLWVLAHAANRLSTGTA